MCDFAALFAGWNWGDLWVDGNYSGTVPNKGLSLENYTYLIDLLKAQNVCEIFSVLIHVKNVCNSFPKGFWYIWFWTPCSSQRGNYRIFMSFRFYVKTKFEIGVSKSAISIHWEALNFDFYELYTFWSLIFPKSAKLRAPKSGQISQF